MKLISLELQNFRQHLDSKIEFSDGVTGIIGPNGAGKSTILEAIAWALYGGPAKRGNNDTLRSTAAPGGSKVCVSLNFDLNGSVYKVTRTIDGSGRSGQAVLEVDGKPVKTGMEEVASSIAKLLGMDYQAFFTSFFTGQKQIEFMAQMDGKQRASAVSRMLGYERLTKARDQANADRLALEKEIKGLEAGLADPEVLKERKKLENDKLSKLKEELKSAEDSLNAARAKLNELKPLKECSEQKAKRCDEIARRLQIDRADVLQKKKRLDQLESEIADLDRKREKLDSLKDELDKYVEAGNEYKRLAELQKFEASGSA